MGRVLRAYDRASLASVYAIDEGVRTVRDIDDQIWAETEEEALEKQVDDYNWKRQAEVELAEFEEGLRLNALRTLYPLPSGAGGDEFVLKRAKREEVAVVDEEQKAKDDKGKEDVNGDDVESDEGGDGGDINNDNNNPK